VQIHLFTEALHHHPFDSAQGQEPPNHHPSAAAPPHRALRGPPSTPLRASISKLAHKRAAPFFKHKTSIITCAHRVIIKSFHKHLLHQPLQFRLHNHQVNPISLTRHRQISGIVPILYPQRLRMNNFPLHIIHQ
jgi:hypothetical protein